MIYVDDPRPISIPNVSRTVSSHLLSDSSLEELHNFAEKLGLKRAWFQTKSSPHYDVLGRRLIIKARRAGAISADAKKVVEIIKFWREKERAK